MELAITVAEASHAFTRWGYMTVDEGFGAVEAAGAQARQVSNSHADTLKRATAQFVQRWAKYFPGHSGEDLDEDVIALMNRRFCNCSDFEPLRDRNASLRKWNSNRLRWVGDVRVGSLSWSTAQAWCIAETARVCGMQIEIAGVGPVNLSSIDRYIDGAGNTVGQAYLPGYPSDAQRDQLRQEFDRSEIHLSQHEFNLVALHEACGHSLGLGHDQTQALAVMDPYLNGDLQGWQPSDASELQARYGQPGEPIDPVDPVDPIDPIDPIDPNRPCKPKELREVTRMLAQMARGLQTE